MTHAAQRSGDPPARQGVGAWWRSAVIYENHLPSFRDGNGDGIGDLHGLIEGLPYLDEVLGVDAVWVGPCYRSPLLDQGYDITDHTDIEPVFGDLATFDGLIEEAHARGMKIIIDYVPNHTSDEHPWFVASRSSRESPYRNWYTWADPGPGGGPPNNWISEIGGSSWEWDQATGQYYLHSHLPEQPDLNWRNAEVRKAMLDVLRFWMDRGADGVRIDVAHMLMKDPHLRDNPLAPEGHTNPYELQPPEFLSQLHVYDRSHPDVHEVMAEIRSLLDGYEDRLAIAELEAMPWGDWAEYFGSDGRGIHLPFAFALIETPWRASAFQETIASLEAALPADAWPILALGNHDRRRLATRLGPAQARVAAMILLTLRGTPVLLYADELGMADQPVPRERQRDHFGLRGGISHDPARTPMPWNDGPNGGFASADAPQSWLPICRDYKNVNVEAQLGDPNSILNLYRHLIRLRRESPALTHGSWDPHPACTDACFIYTRAAEGELKLVALNLTGESQDLALLEQGVIVLSTGLDRAEETVRDGLVLRPDEGVILDLEPGVDPNGSARNSSPPEPNRVGGPTRS